MQRWIFTSPNYDDFRTSCLINNKVCSLMIDSDLQDNFVAEKVVNYFQLTTDKHMAPYSIQFGEDEYAQVTEVCKVLIAIGKFYKEDVTCHVVDMDDTYVSILRCVRKNLKKPLCQLKRKLKMKKLIRSSNG